MAGNSTKPVEIPAEEERSRRERNLPRHLIDNAEVPGQDKLQTVKNRRKSIKANPTKKRNHRIGRCSLKRTCPVEGCNRRHHPQLHVATETRNLNPSAETFHPPQAAGEETPNTGTAATYANCGMIEEPKNETAGEKTALKDHKRVQQVTETNKSEEEETNSGESLFKVEKVSSVKTSGKQFNAKITF
ncbi:hypothetical protein ACROYT_G013662 [Oculina patagonica]